MIRRIVALVALVWVLGFAAFMLQLDPPLSGRTSDAIVVPTGGPGRIDRGLALLRDGAAGHMLVTGVDPTVKPGEFAAEYKVPAKLLRCCIDLGHEAVDTRSNADETAAWVRKHDFHSLRLVTSNWHMARASLELRHAVGPDVTVLRDPVPDKPRFAILFSEYHKLIIRWIVLAIGWGS